jgi:hypothetical protein
VKGSPPSVRLDASVLGTHGRRCAFFRTRDEEYRVLAPFIRDGVFQGDRGFHIVDPARRHDHRRRLAAAGLDVERLEREGALEIRDWRAAHLRDGHFDRKRMIALAGEAIAESRRRGFRHTRFVTHMEWALASGTSMERLAEYESTANHAVPPDGDPVICVYDLTRWGGQALVDAIQSHPLIIIGGILHENPFFVPPDEFLRELRDRAAAGAAP